MKNEIRYEFLWAWIFCAFSVFSACSAPQSQAPEPVPAETQTAAQVETEDGAQVPEEEDPFAVKEMKLPEPGAPIGMIGARRAQSLSGDWKLIIDPMGVGNPGVLDPGFFHDAKNITGMELIEYDFDAANDVRVPGDFNTQDERLFFYRGQVWYRKKFDASPKRGERKHLHFGAANFHAQVFLNGKSVGEHAGGYVPFSFDVTDALESGENTLVVRVDNRLTDSTIPTGRTDWWPYGGLTGDVSLITTPKGFIRNAKVALTDREAGEITVRLEIEDLRAGTNARVDIPELSIDRAGTIDQDGHAEIVFNAAPDLWSPDHPRLYHVTFSAGTDTVTERVGFRTIETRGTEILLNGTPIKLKGVSTHAEPIGEPGIAHSRDHAEGLLREAKALGANFVRAAHYPYSRHMAEAADEIGLLLWEEIPVYWSIDWDNPDTLAIARDQMQRLVMRDWNRASVVIWSVANETPLSDGRMRFLTTLIDDTRAMDDTRLVTAALLGGSRESFERIVTHLAVRALDQGGLSAKERFVFTAVKARAGLGAPKPDDIFTLTIDDPLGELVDIVSYNEYFGWYYSKIFADQMGIGEDVLRPLMLDFMPLIRITASADKPVHISEFGAGAKAGMVGGTEIIWSEEYQAAVYRAQIDMLTASDQVQGMTPRILKDFRAMLRTRGGVQDFYNRKGLIDENGEKKLAYDVLQDFYEGEW